LEHALEDSRQVNISVHAMYPETQMEDLVTAAREIMDAKKYEGEIKSNLQAATNCNQMVMAQS